MTKTRVFVLVAIIALIAAFFVFDLGHYFSLDYFKSQQAAINDVYIAHPLRTAAIFFAVYVAVAALSIPGAAVMTLVAGAIFGVIEGLVLVSFASTIGACLAFLAARFVLRDSLRERYGDRLRKIDAGIERDGGFSP